ncbi:MAG: hypothetical protein RIC30_11105 [Marinoscillum sp.]
MSYYDHLEGRRERKNTLPGCMMLVGFIVGMIMLIRLIAYLLTPVPIQ